MEKLIKFLSNLRETAREQSIFVAVIAIVIIGSFCIAAYAGNKDATPTQTKASPTSTNAIAEKKEKPEKEQPESSEEKSPEEVQEELNDLGDENLVNVQQTPDNSFLYDIAISDLCNADTSYQKTTVQVKGEAVGDPIKAEQNPGKYWITLDAAPDEKEGSLSVLVDESALDAIDTYGGYDARGTIVRVKGIFHLACTSHEGIIDIHADTVTAVDAGYIQKDEFNILDFYPGLFMCALGAFLAAGYRLLAEGER